jgi:DNA-binding transcriptional MerR regulator
MTTTAPSGCVDVFLCAKAAGIKPGSLRMWEMRYGWPKPSRQANGYRFYQPALVEQIALVAEWVRRGRRVSDLIRDGQPCLPTELAPGLLDDLRAQVAELIEALSMTPAQRYSAEGQARVEHAAHRCTGGQSIHEELASLRERLAMASRPTPPAPVHSEAPVARALESRADAVAGLRVALGQANARAEDLAKRLDLCQRAQQRMAEVDLPLMARRVQVAEDRAARAEARARAKVQA